MENGCWWMFLCKCSCFNLSLFVSTSVCGIVYIVNAKWGEGDKFYDRHIQSPLLSGCILAMDVSFSMYCTNSWKFSSAYKHSPHVMLLHLNDSQNTRLISCVRDADNNTFGIYKPLYLFTTHLFVYNLCNTPNI